MASSSSHNTSNAASGHEKSSVDDKARVKLTIPDVDPSKTQQTLEAITKALKKAGATNIEITIEGKWESVPSKRANLLQQMIDRSPAPGITIMKMLFFGFIALVVFIFCVMHAFEKGDPTVIFSFVIVFLLAFLFFFLDDIGRLQR